MTRLLTHFLVPLLISTSVMASISVQPSFAAETIRPNCPSTAGSSQIIPNCPVYYVYNSTIQTTQQGFDVCSAPNTTVMQNWWNGTPYYFANIYIGGINRGCSQPNLNSSWTYAVSLQGWTLVPTWVDLQSPCENSSGYGATMSWYGPTAYNQGVSAATNAVAADKSLSIGPGTIIYDDIEDFYSTNSSCYLAVANFVNGWSTELHALGYKAGVYENICCNDLPSLYSYTPYITPPDDIWIAAWNGDSSIAGVDSLAPSGGWVNHQRLHQFSGNVWQTNNGSTLNVDLDRADGGVASL